MTRRFNWRTFQRGYSIPFEHYASNISFVAYPQSITILVSSAPPNAEAGKTFPTSKPSQFPNNKGGKSVPGAADIDGAAKSATDQAASLGSAVKDKVAKSAPDVPDIDGAAKAATEKAASVVGNAVNDKVGSDIKEAKAAIN